MKTRKTNIKLLATAGIVAMTVAALPMTSEASSKWCGVSNCYSYCESGSNYCSKHAYKSPSVKTYSSKNSYEDGYDDIYYYGYRDWDRYKKDKKYAMGVDDALTDWEDFGEDW